MLTNLELYYFYSWSTVGLSTILIVLYTAALYVIRKETKVPFVFSTMTEMIVSNFGAILTIYCNFKIVNPELKLIYWFMFLQIVSACFRDACFNTAHWRFAFQYYNSAVAMPYLRNRQQDVPADRRKRLDATYNLVFALCIACPVIYSGIVGYSNCVE